MQMLKWIMNRLCYQGNAWALREIHPLHPDVPRIMVRLSELREQEGRILTAR